LTTANYNPSTAQKFEPRSKQTSTPPFREEIIEARVWWNDSLRFKPQHRLMPKCKCFPLELMDSRNLNTKN